MLDFLRSFVVFSNTLFRLPRTHPDVLANVTDLAHCIRIMPTSGSQFTAQAPLFPVFLLGIVAVDPEHKKQCLRWFEQVVSTPVRSVSQNSIALTVVTTADNLQSVPPLFKALRRIWGWMDKEVPNPSTQASLDLHPNVGTRDAWWETLVAKVDEYETEVLCLT